MTVEICVPKSRRKHNCHLTSWCYERQLKCWHAILSSEVSLWCVSSDGVGNMKELDQLFTDLISSVKVKVSFRWKNENELEHLKCWFQNVTFKVNLSQSKRDVRSRKVKYVGPVKTPIEM